MYQQYNNYTAEQINSLPGYLTPATHRYWPPHIWGPGAARARGAHGAPSAMSSRRRGRGRDRADGGCLRSPVLYIILYNTALHNTPDYPPGGGWDPRILYNTAIQIKIRIIKNTGRHPVYCDALAVRTMAYDRRWVKVRLPYGTNCTFT